MSVPLTLADICGVDGVWVRVGGWGGVGEGAGVKMNMAPRSAVEPSIDR